MRLQILPRSSAISYVVNGTSANNYHSQGVLNRNLTNDEFMLKLLNRRWALSSPDSKISQIAISKQMGSQLNGDVSYRNITQHCTGEGLLNKKNPTPSFYVVRDDLLHPLINGNKARKLDALLPLLENNAVTDVVTCGGCQSAHAAAVAVSCSEKGIKSHLLLRGEEPETLTGYNLVSKLYGNIVYVPRSEYAKREEMLNRHAESISGHDGSTIIRLNDIFNSNTITEASGRQADAFEYSEKSRKVVIINEGAGDAIALLGVMRLVKYMSEERVFGKTQALEIVVDAGTGTTAVGLALGALFLGLPWKVTAVMLADKIGGYRKKEESLMSEFLKCSAFPYVPTVANAGIVRWVERVLPRKFGNVMKGEVEECRKIAQQTGILVDPMYTLAAWELSSQLSQSGGDEETKVVMLHTGGTLGMFGLAQRYKSYFRMCED